MLALNSLNLDFSIYESGRVTPSHASNRAPLPLGRDMSPKSANLSGKQLRLQLDISSFIESESVRVGLRSDYGDYSAQRQKQTKSVSPWVPQIWKGPCIQQHEASFEMSIGRVSIVLVLEISKSNKTAVHGLSSC